MRTACPVCQTAFHVTPTHLRVRAGRVRCGRCGAAFNALDNLLDDDAPTPDPAVAESIAFVPPVSDIPASDIPVSTAPPPEPAADLPATSMDAAPTPPETPDADPEIAAPGGAMLARLTAPDDETADLLPPQENRSLQKTDDADGTANGDEIVPPPRMAQPEARHWLASPVGKPVPITARQQRGTPYLVVALLLLLALVGQSLFHFRTALAIALPGMRPVLATLSGFLGTDIPLPRHIDLVNIESSDLQSEPGGRRLLILQSTLRNRANYPQAYPALELTLTDVDDKAIARRVLFPRDYLPSKAEAAFPANADLEFRLGLDTTGIDSAGYRLYVFYP
ncbi:MAG TPA: DUF3426 domain-containing protein [Accumulibacter sp.]|jgi:predicted Zn finger-like uncharacterized protein|nr:DUF3426 domain-containing protein [Accumulibacter sp.]